MTDLYDHIARTIRQLRSSYGGNGLSQAALAVQIGTTANTISRWETESYKPSAKELDQMARFFNVPITVFFPELAAQEDVSVKTQALLSALGDLNEDEIDEVTRYAQYRKAHRNLPQVKPKKRRVE
ncbi:MAG: helix-turn-helix domain-containing protein [Proteobacteria bacterium]|nr:helix-turn-helix domain-containing protein [Pseudomonadota bacterium]